MTEVLSCDQAKLLTSSPYCTSYLGEYSLPNIYLRKSLYLEIKIFFFFFSHTLFLMNLKRGLYGKVVKVFYCTEYELHVLKAI